MGGGGEGQRYYGLCVVGLSCGLWRPDIAQQAISPSNSHTSGGVPGQKAHKNVDKVTTGRGVTPWAWHLHHGRSERQGPTNVSAGISADRFKTSPLPPVPSPFCGRWKQVHRSLLT